MSYKFVGNTPSILKIRELIKVVSDTSFNVLITGETGTGKEVVARMLHEASQRRKQRFIKVNCAALPLNLLESELFGYEKGAFTGADRSKQGKFEAASDGVIFLDEIGDMPMILQAKLLEVLQSGKFVRLGGTNDVAVNTWVISSTNHNLQEEMRKSLFREDLYYRLNIINIQMPPLRERRGDIHLLTNHFIERYARELKTPVHPSLPEELRSLFEVYHWPGNVRELSSTVLRLMVGEEPEVIGSELLTNMRREGLLPTNGFPGGPLQSKGSEKAEGQEGEESAPPSPSLLEIKAEATRTIERQAILYALRNMGWKKRAAARLLKISHKALYYKMEELGIGKDGEMPLSKPLSNRVSRSQD